MGACSKKVAASSVLASLNTFSAASGDFAKVMAIFLPPTTYKTTKGKNDGDLRKFVKVSFRPLRTACGFAKQERDFLSIPLYTA